MPTLRKQPRPATWPWYAQVSGPFFCARRQLGRLT